MLDEKDRRRSRCIRCGTCDGHPCLVNAKSDAQVICVDPALEYPNVTLMTNAYVSRLETSTSGRLRRIASTTASPTCSGSFGKIPAGGRPASFS